MTRVMLESGIGPLGELVFASSMVGVDPRDRPRVRCPECDDLLTFKAGERGIVTPHVAHRSGSACAATNPETAAHFNAKMLLTRVLNTSGTLRLRTKCYRAGHHVEADWHVPAWQRAEAEFRVDTRRPDVAVFGEGDAVVGAVEVLHTHRVDRRKASDYAAGGLPWVEFRAEHVLAWDGKGALPVEAADRETLRELVRSCAGCHEADRPRPPPLSPEEIAEQARKFRAALETLKVRHRVTPEAEAANRREMERRAKYDALDRRAKAGATPSLNVVVAARVVGDRAALGVVCCRAGAVPVVEVVALPPPAKDDAAVMMAADMAMRLVEEKARRSVTLCAFSTTMRDLNFGGGDDPLRCRVAEAIARTKSVALPTYAVRLAFDWHAVVSDACDAALRGADAAATWHRRETSAAVARKGAA